MKWLQILGQLERADVVVLVLRGKEMAAMHDNHELVDTLLKGVSEADRRHLLEIIRLSYLREQLPEGVPTRAQCRAVEVGGGR